MSGPFWSFVTWRGAGLTEEHVPAERIRCDSEEAAFWLRVVLLRDGYEATEIRRGEF